MNRTVDHLIHTMFEELSVNRVRKFTITDLTKASKVTRGTIYYYFDSIEDIYMATFEKKILNVAIKESDDFNKFIGKFILYISENKTFSLNFYRLAELSIRKKFLINIFNSQLLKYNFKINPDNIYLVSGLCFIVINWLDNSLEMETDLVIQEVNHYLEFFQITFKQI
ncbi:TetR/AcrR family transcriptional regulator [Companilactobacillus kimchii]|uniref:HTH tetR-type domain-containing protein n=2 Tax=Companilactobacillus kimchii TaxID=2801452 RepID=A0ABR5NQW9_9LACO|nr:TetR/AcrR family transcriptional regulator [Companilactobacillus kimchii]GEO47813.1 hypothetical protein LKI01_18120 [Companilactobacillus paralimentarius]KAE9559149.1 hypothetical protein ATN91_12660 [Companilactobacillus kimchii]KAE9560931.1 hypothetical protein ATN91_09015 [Companilactobacillus kimchii]KRK50087.1 hypothetical protein FC97_GL001816 [Companilactobacillus kimchii DSM 13961 = JCM 10707]OWF32268.1 hypothetical protein LKACC12383_02293 [Companilactobacillus kimchii]